MALVLLPVIGGPEAAPAQTALALVVAIGKALLFAVLIWALGTRLLAPVMERVARTRSRELLTLAVFVAALGIAAFAAEVFHMSVALGAFFAGLIVGQSRIGPQAAADMAPFRDVFSALFFVSIGMLFDPAVLVNEPAILGGAIAIVLVLKPLAALGIVLLLRDTVRTALTVAVGLAQIGEFSFILAALGAALGMLPKEATDVLVATAIVSIAVNPLLFRLLPSLERRFGAQSIAAAAPYSREEADEPKMPVIVHGLGDQARGHCAVFGDASRDEVLAAANARDARVLVLTRGTLAEKMRVCTAIRRVNPRAAIVATAQSQAERAWLEEYGAAYVADVREELTGALLRAVRRAL